MGIGFHKSVMLNTVKASGVGRCWESFMICEKAPSRIFSQILMNLFYLQKPSAFTLFMPDVWCFSQRSLNIPVDYIQDVFHKMTVFSKQGLHEKPTIILVVNGVEKGKKRTRNKNTSSRVGHLNMRQGKFPLNLTPKFCTGLLSAGPRTLAEWRFITISERPSARRLMVASVLSTYRS